MGHGNSPWADGCGVLTGCVVHSCQRIVCLETDGKNLRRCCVGVRVGDSVHWYLVHSKPHQESVAKSNLQWLGVETFFPQLRQLKIIRRRKQFTISPLFPGYLFSRFDMATEFRKVTYAQGVRKVVMFGSFPAQVDEETIASIKARIQVGYLHRRSSSFKVGQVVQIKEGPFLGLEVVFEKDLSGAQRVALLLKTVAYQARIIINREQLANL